jgi:hypothetical protein
MDRILLASAVCLAVLSATALEAATLIPVAPVPGSIETDVFAINDNNMIAGGYITPDQVEHGFFGPLGGPYTTFDLGTGTTQARGIANDGSVAEEFIGAGGHCAWLQFIRPPGGTDTPVTKGHKALKGIIGNFSAKGQFVGDYCQSGGIIAGYLGKGTKYNSDITIEANNVTTSPRGINKSGTVAGFFIDAATDGDTSFVLRNGETSVISYPDESQTDTLLQDVNNAGVAVGHWDAGDFVWHAFMLDTNSNTFTQIDVPGATFTQSFGINNAGLVAIISDAGPFIYCPRKASKCPGAGTAVAANPVRAGALTLLRQAKEGSKLAHRSAAKPEGARDGDGVR